MIKNKKLQYAYKAKKKFDSQQSDYYFSCVEKEKEESIIIARYTKGAVNRMVGRLEIMLDGTIINLPIE